MKVLFATTIAAVAFGASAAFAMPVANVAQDSATLVPVRTVCDEYGRCFERRTDVGRDIARGILNGVEGRSVYRDRDYDRYRDRGFRDRDYGYDRRRDYDRY
jgi:hypothetical protein